MVKVVGEPCSPLPLLSPIRETEWPNGMVQYLPQSAELLVLALQRSGVQMNVSRIADDNILHIDNTTEIGRVLGYEELDITNSRPPTPKMTLTTKEMDMNERMADKLLKSIISMNDNDMQPGINSFIDYDHDDDEEHMTHNSIADLQRDLENAVHCLSYYDDDDAAAIENDSRLLHRLKRWFLSLDIITDQKILQAYYGLTLSNNVVMYAATIINIIGASLGIGYVFNSAVVRFCARIAVVLIMMRSKRVKPRLNEI